MDPVRHDGEGGYLLVESSATCLRGGGIKGFQDLLVRSKGNTSIIGFVDSVTRLVRGTVPCEKRFRYKRDTFE